MLLYKAALDALNWLPRRPFNFLYRTSLLLNEYHLHYHKCGVNSDKGEALPSSESAEDDRGDSHQRHNGEHNGKVKNKGRVQAEEGRAFGEIEGVDGYSRAGNKHEIEDVRADNVSKRKRAVTLNVAI